MVNEMVEISLEMKRFGVYSPDTHSGNVAWNDEGKERIVFFDVGIGSHDGRQLKNSPITMD